MSKLTFPTGKFDIARGFETLRAQGTDPVELRYLDALEKAIREVLGIPVIKVPDSKVKIITPLPIVTNPSFVDDVDAYLRDGFSNGYRLNLRSRLNTLLTQSPREEEHKYIKDGWWEAFSEKLPALQRTEHALGYWLEYTEQNKIWPVIEVGQSLLTEFQNYLADQKKLRRHSTAYQVRRRLRDILKAAGLFRDEKKRELFINVTLRGEIDQVRIFAHNHHLSDADKNSIRVRQKGGNAKPVQKRTFEKLESEIRNWLRFLETQNVDLKKIQMQDFFNDEFVLDYLDHLKLVKNAARATAESFLDNIKSLARMASERGVIQLNLQEFRKAINKHFDLLPNNFKRVKVRKKAPGIKGLPSLGAIHRPFINKFKIERVRFMEIFSLDYSPMLPIDQQPSRLHETALEVRGCFLMATALFLSPRIGDVTILSEENIQIIEDTTGSFFHVYYEPKKTQHHDEPPIVDMCLPDWLMSFYKDYLLIKKFIHPDSKKLFPASWRYQGATGDGTKKKIGHDQFLGFSEKWFGQELTSNNMRRIVTSAYSEFGLGGLYLVMGHSVGSTSRRDRDDLTELEVDSYFELNNERRIRKAKIQYGILRKELGIPDDLDMGFLDEPTRQLLRTGALKKSG